MKWKNNLRIFQPFWNQFHMSFLLTPNKITGSGHWPPYTSSTSFSLFWNSSISHNTPLFTPNIIQFLVRALEWSINCFRVFCLPLKLKNLFKNTNTWNKHSYLTSIWYGIKMSIKKIIIQNKFILLNI